jgi:hypothetical protein
MLSLKISILPIRDGERASGTLAIDRKRGDAWVGEKTLTLVSGDPGSERTIVLADDQRITFAGSSGTEVVYDKQQMAAVSRPKALPVASPGDDDDLSPEVPLADIDAQQFEERKAAEARIKAKEAAAKEFQEQAAKLKAAQEEQAAADNAKLAGKDPIDQTTTQAAKVDTAPNSSDQPSTLQATPSSAAGAPGGAKSSLDVKGDEDVPQQGPQEAKTPAGWPQPKPKNGV